MVNAFTFDDGSPKSFNNRKAMYDYMIENGHMVVEGDDAPKFKEHVDKIHNDKQHRLTAKATALKNKLEE